MPLTAITVRDSKPSKTTKRLYDTGGLYLEISPSGGKWWRIKYRFGGKEKRLSLGTYPDITLKKARELRDNERLLLRDGVDPSDARKAKKVAEGGGESFEAIAREWFARFSQNWAESHSKKVMGRLEKDIFPWIGTKPISKITTPELLTMLRRIESRGAQETAYRAKMNCGQVFRYAVTTGRAEHNPANDLRGAIPRGKVRHRAALTDPKKVGGLLRAIDDYCGYYVVRYALQFAPLVFTRPSELRFAEWNEVDLASSEWRIPSHKMKMKEQHIVPLAGQTVHLLEELQQLTGRGRFLFPSIRTFDRPISENTVTAALRRMGFTKEEMSWHGFRGMASTLLNEIGFHPDWIERQLAHSERNHVRACYNHAQYLQERRDMMQTWADYLDSLRGGADVIPLKKALR